MSSDPFLLLNPLFFFTEALHLYGHRLSEYEKIEIEKYSKIWYLGLDACKIHGEPGGSQNGGYDDDSGSYNKVSALISIPLFRSYKCFMSIRFHFFDITNNTNNFPNFLIWFVPLSTNRAELVSILHINRPLSWIRQKHAHSR